MTDATLPPTAAALRRKRAPSFALLARTATLSAYVAAGLLLALVFGHVLVAFGDDHTLRLRGLAIVVVSEALLAALLFVAYRADAAASDRDENVLGLDLTALTRGMLGFGFVAATVGLWRGIDTTGLLYKAASGAMAIAGSVSIVGAGFVCGWRARRDRRSVADIARDVGAPILAQTRTASWFVVGIVLALPGIALHGSVASDSDSARILSNVTYMRHHGLGLLQQTQDVFLPNFVYWATAWLGGPSAARWVPILAFFVLSGTICALAYKVSRSALIAVAATLAFVASPIILYQTSFLALYSITLTVAIVAVYLVWTAGNAERIDARAAMLGALCFVVGAEAHAIGQIFFVIPVLLVILGPAGRRLRVAAIVYATTAVLMIPRLLVNLSVGGTKHLRSNYDTYTLDKGYLDIINNEYYGHPVQDSVGVYAQRLAEVFGTTFAWQGVIIGVLAIVGLFAVPRRVRVLAIAFVALYIGSMLATKPAPYPRYFLPLVPVFALLAGFGVHDVWRRFRSRRPLVPVACIAVLAAVAGVTSFQQVRDLRVRDHRVEASALPHIASLITDGKGVIGVRSPQLAYVDSEQQIYGSLYLDEKDYVTYLTWPSDEKVLAMMARHDIGWIFIQANRGLEVNYPGSWLEPVYGKSPTFIQGILASPKLCPVYSEGGFELWKVGTCIVTDPRWSSGQFVPAVPTPQAIGEPDPLDEPPVLSG